ncbi:hypothetical protein F2Q69_00038369 [Brassica cretica]|uniref:Uncharacterized protein n=1 Tax=Brassica cretica TaxID=69181 RepID=A0A8S9SRE7_BRACR|nr:hypothetical protein F2Q69_00038369 [Brassica cretica]
MVTSVCYLKVVVARVAEVALKVVVVTSLSRHEASLKYAPFLLLLVVDHEILVQSGCSALLVLVHVHLTRYHLFLVFPLQYSLVESLLLVVYLDHVQTDCFFFLHLFTGSLVGVRQGLHPSLGFISQSSSSGDSFCT